MRGRGKRAIFFFFFWRRDKTDDGRAGWVIGNQVRETKNTRKENQKTKKEKDRNQQKEKKEKFFFISIFLINEFSVFLETLHTERECRLGIQKNARVIKVVVFPFW